MLNFFALILPLSSSYLILRILRLKGFTDSILAFYCLFTAHIIASGYIVSLLNHLADLKFWAISGLLELCIALTIVLLTKNFQASTLHKIDINFIPYLYQSLTKWYREKTTSYEKLIIIPLFLTILLIGITNSIIIIFVAPHNWDSMTVNIARIGYYLQQGNLNYFDSNFVFQNINPKNATLLLIFTYLISGKNENLMQLVQFISYCISILCVYKISRIVGNSRNQSIFASLVSALLIEWLMQATTTQKDLLVTSYIGLVVYFLFSFKYDNKIAYLFLAALGISLSAGSALSTIVSLPSVFFIIIFCIFCIDIPKKYKLKYLTVFTIFTLITITMFVLPAGYIGNFQKFGHLVGPKEVTTGTSFEGKPVSYILKNGSLNLARYGIQFISLDGLPPLNIVQEGQHFIRELPEKVSNYFRINLQSTEGIRFHQFPFRFEKTPVAHEDGSYWGIVGFGLIWIAVLLALFGVVKSLDIRILAFTAILFFITMSYYSPYDPFLNRYFVTAAIFATPTVGFLLSCKNLFIRLYIFSIVIIQCISASSSIIFRQNSSPITINFPVYTQSIFSMDRIQQLTRNRPDYYEAINQFDQLVPLTATVAVYLPGDSYEYPLFGQYLTRLIIPVSNSINRGIPLSKNAEYLLYFKGGYFCNIFDDIHLGADWYLRDLRFHGFKVLDGLDSLEGPYPQWNLPKVRWGLGPATKLNIDLGETGTSILNLEAKPLSADQDIEVILNGASIFTHSFMQNTSFESIDIPLKGHPGQNLVELRYKTWHTPSDKEPDLRQMAVLYKRISLNVDCHVFTK